jgi:ubiquinone/menaquinone biosynthesis C-methylase UbiE
VSSKEFLPLERIVVPDDAMQSPDCLIDVERYRFACRYVAGKRILDIASGSGYGSSMLLTLGGAASVIGVDNSAEAIAAARGKYGSARVQFDMGTAEGIPLPSDSIDVAISIETFEHLQNPTLLLRELNRVLVAGGLAILSTPRNESATRVHPINPFHIREYSWDEFGEIVMSVFPHHERWSQVTTYADPLLSPSIDHASAPIRAVLRKMLPQRVRRALRRTVGSPGLIPARSEIIFGMDPHATVQVALCYKN